MIHIVHLIQRRLGDKPVRGVLPLLIVAGLALLAGLGLLLAN